jgi:hypothetical protein
MYPFNVYTINLSLRYTFKCIRKGQAQPYHLTDDVSQLYSRMTKGTAMDGERAIDSSFRPQ